MKTGLKYFILFIKKPFIESMKHTWREEIWKGIFNLLQRIDIFKG
jgi:hypothetical protein